jgi:hypothetical protein
MFLHLGRHFFLFNHRGPSLGRSMLAIILIPIALGCAHSGKAETQQDPFSAFMQTDAARKLSPALRRKLQNLGEGDAVDERLSLVFSLKHPLAGFERDQLEQGGVLIRNAVGTIVTATAPAEKIPALSSLNFVETIELPVTLGPKGEKDAE